MITLKLTANTGNTWATRFNGTFADAVAYFMGAQFTRENDETGAEIVDTVTTVEII